ncbi:MAG: SPOR domain-containing protein [Brevundimonas sp.]|uniref:SPOR domain-containing protein n=1 Tax=Brevundimonas sp. TaxID=1871086 RepID=UPI0024871D6D|nr:SPOR domain-containing protein [Brevundimonas sp.]MDI1326310.1 SPOR domain-containing protein [Brevundimonas sp.]
MTPSLLIRPVLVLFAASGLTACGMVESDPHRFETLAESVAAIPLDGGPRVQPASTSHRTVTNAGLRPAIRVEVLDPHALWDARDAEVNRMVARAAPRVVAAAAPAVADAVVQQVSTRIDNAASRAGLRPAILVRPAVAPAAGRALVQLGAYSSEASARAAWSRLKGGEAAWALDGLSPVYEAVEVGGRQLTRLKVRAPAAGARAVCAAAGVDDPWCRRSA